MKRFIVKISLFAILLIVLLKIIDATRPYYYGNPYFVSKMEDFEVASNVVFFGSSRIGSQINPIVFDSVTSTLNFKSYNLGIQACFNPESYFLAKHFMKSQQAANVKYLFLELQKLSDIDPSNSLTTRGHYWNSLSEMGFIFSYLKNSTHLSKLKKAKIWTKYTISYMYKQVAGTRISSLFKKIEEEEDEEARNFEKGFKPLFKELADSTEAYKNLDVLKDYKQKIENYKALNAAHVNALNEIVDLGKKHGIEVYFILAPKWNNYQFALEILSGLEAQRVVDMTKSINIQRYYLPKYSADGAHLNLEGSNMYTGDLARIFVDKLEARQ